MFLTMQVGLFELSLSDVDPYSHRQCEINHASSAMLNILTNVYRVIPRQLLDDGRLSNHT